ncbi:MAG: 1,4-alpha-glucan branching protein, partial [Actinomycetota bacterium]
MLHTHLPYLKHNGVWPSGEDLFHQAVSESYLPLLEMFGRLADDGFTDVCTLGVSPMVGHQLADDHMLDELGWFLGRYEPRAIRNAVMYEGAHRDEVRALAGFYATWARRRCESLDAQVAVHGDLRSAFASLGARGVVELLGGPLTHPLMPETHPHLAELQMRLGRQAFAGTDWGGIWLPECHYRPGVEETLDRQSVTHLVVDGPTMIRSGGDTTRPRRIADSAVVAFARDLDSTYKVWSPTGGYPSGKWYRDFFHYDIEAGFKDWRVTGTRKPLHQKRPYEPQAAIAAARTDAADFVAHIVRTLQERTTTEEPDPMIVAAYDTELFGHWWFEGPVFLEEVLRTLAAS